MSFVQKLRMNNIFPTGGMNLGFSGELPQYGGADPLQEILSLYDSRAGQRETPMLHRIANQNIGRSPHDGPTGNSNLKFGGVVGHDSNPGADILRRAARNSEHMGQTPPNEQLSAGEAKAIKEKQFPHFGDSVDVDKQLDRKTKETNLELAKTRVRNESRRVDIAEFKSKNPNLKFIPVKGGNIMAFNPQTGDSEDTGIATNTLTEEQRIKMIHENTMAKQNDAQAATATKPTTPSQLKHSVDLRIQEAINRNPQWKDYIDLETGMIAPVGAGASWVTGNKGLDEATRQQILNTIYGGGSTTPPPTTVPNPPVATPTNQNNASPAVTPAVQPTTPTAQRIRIQMADGQKGMWRADKPLPAGAVRIQ